MTKSSKAPAPIAVGPGTAAEDAPVVPADAVGPIAEGETEPPDRDFAPAGREPGELIAALSPRQIVGGFALLAGLLLIVGRRARRKG
jgi:hypothetical protein